MRQVALIETEITEIEDLAAEYGDLLAQKTDIDERIGATKGRLIEAMRRAKKERYIRGRYEIAIQNVPACEQLKIRFLSAEDSECPKARAATGGAA